MKLALIISAIVSSIVLVFYFVLEWMITSPVEGAIVEATADMSYGWIIPITLTVLFIVGFATLVTKIMNKF